MADEELPTYNDVFADLYRDAGLHPGWNRVWRDGRDVTDDDPSTWPSLWNADAPRRRGRGRRR